MTQYEIHIQYKDEKSVNILVSEKEVGRFFEALNSSKVYEHPESKAGFWTNIQDVRYITLSPKESAHVETEREDEPSPDTVQEGDENPEG